MSDSTAPAFRFRGKTPPPTNRHGIRAELAVKDNGTTATIRLYDPIDSWGDPFGVSAKEFSDTLDGLSADVTEIRVHINSPGGEVFDGIAILNALRNHSARYVAVVDGIAASAASFIAAGADEVVMGRNSQLMIHDAEGIALGNAADMRDLADRLDHFSDNIASIYQEKAGGDLSRWRDAMLAESWYSATEAVEAGLADSVSKQEPAKPTNSFDLSIFNYTGRDKAPAPFMPAQNTAQTPSTEPVQGNPRGEDGTMPTLNEELRQRLGITDDADEATILAALDEALTERAEPETPEVQPTTSLPAGTVAVDEATLNQLRDDARRGAEARAQQETDARNALVDAAVRDGRIAPARREQWQNTLAADPGAADTLANLAKGLIPVTSEVGYSGESNAVDLSWFDAPKGA